MKKFSISDISDHISTQMINNSVWQEECPIPISRLRLLEVSHYNFSNQTSTGQLVVLDKLAQSVISIFEELLAIKFPIHSLKLIEEFNGNDNLSMSKNNSSCFNFRTIEGTNILSMHSYGAAIDINPLQNPFIIIDDNSHEIKILPKKGTEYLNRHNIRHGMVEPIVNIFKKHGFSDWGGKWNTPIDYHHFQVARSQIDALIS